MKGCKRRLHQFKSGIVENGLICEDYPDGGSHIDGCPEEELH
jgi:hypothetical protein